MVDQRYIELINKKIDGTITDHENRDLEVYLAEDGGARRLYDEMARLPELIRQIDMTDPPPDLKQRILGSIDLMRYKSPAGRKRLSDILNAFRRPAVLRYAYCFAAGLLIGFVVYAASVGNGDRRMGLDPRDVSGTIVTGEEIESFQILDEKRIELEGIAGSLVTAVAGDIVLLRLSVTSAEEIELAFEYDQGALNFHGYRDQEAQGGSLEITPGHLRIGHQGENGYLIVFENTIPSGTTVMFGIYAGELLYDYPVKTGMGDR